MMPRATAAQIAVALTAFLLIWQICLLGVAARVLHVRHRSSVLFYASSPTQSHLRTSMNTADCDVTWLDTADVQWRVLTQYVRDATNVRDIFIVG